MATSQLDQLATFRNTLESSGPAGWARTKARALADIQAGLELDGAQVATYCEVTGESEEQFWADVQAEDYGDAGDDIESEELEPQLHENQEPYYLGAVYDIAARGGIDNFDLAQLEELEINLLRTGVSTRKFCADLEAAMADIQTQESETSCPTY